MGKVLEALRQSDVDFLERQVVFFVATAPRNFDHAANGPFLNVSPKGGRLHVLSPTSVAYLDMTGSGSETAAHVLENQSMVLMACNLQEGPPKILRIHGTAQVYSKDDPSIPSSLVERFSTTSEWKDNPGFRALFVIQAMRISTSCGYSLPVHKFERKRTALDEYMAKLDNPNDYRVRKNSFSIDWMPSIALLSQSGKSQAIVPDPSDGYVFGRPARPGEEHIAKEHRQSLEASVISVSKSSISTKFWFGLGSLLGLLIGFATVWMNATIILE